MSNKRITKKQKLKKDVEKCKATILLLSNEIDNLYGIFKRNGIK